MTCLELRFFSGFDAVWKNAGQPGEPVRDLALHKVQALLAYLVLHHERTHTRAYLAGLLWPDVSEEKARTSLRTALAILRKQLEITPGLERGAYLYADELSVRWQPKAEWWCDAVEFARLIEQARKSNRSEDYESASHLYTGTLLDGWYDDWVLPLQERWQQWYADALERLIIRYEELHNAKRALDAAQRLIHLDPLREDAYRAVMRAYAALGERAMVREQYYRCKHVLATQLRVNPSKATVQLYRTLMSADPSQGTSTGEGEKSVVAPANPPQPVLPAPVAPVSSVVTPESGLPMVGREAELTELLRIWDATRHGQGGLIMLEGEAGIGKTRLIQALATQATGAGGMNLTGGAYTLGASVPFAPLLEAIRAPLLETPSPLLSGLAPAWRAELAMLWPALWAVWSDLPPNPPLPSDHSQLRLFEALTQLVLHVSRNQPVLLVLEDMHWADSSTMSWLGYILRGRRFTNAPVMLVLTLRPEEMVSQPALQEWHRMVLATSGLQRQTLGRLEQSDVSSIVAALLNENRTTGQEANLSSQLIQRLYTKSDGNPLFVVELVRSWQTAGLLAAAVEGTPPALQGFAAATEAEPALPLPQRLQIIIAERIAHLGENAQILLRAAAAIGQTIPATLLLEASELERETALAALEELMQHGVLVSGAGDQLHFSHEKLRETMYTGMNQFRQRALHRKIAAVLEKQDPSLSSDLAEQLAYHYGLSDQPARALEYEIQAGDRAVALGALPVAARYYTRSISRLEQQPVSAERDRRLLAIYLRLFPAIYRRDPPASSLERLRAAEQLALKLDDHVALAEIYLARGRIYFISGKQPEADAEYQRSLVEQDSMASADLAGEEIPGYGVNRGWTYMLMGQSLYAQGNHRQAYTYLLRSLPELERVGSLHEIGRCNTRLAGCTFYLMGDYDRTMHYLDHAQRMAEIANDSLLQSDIAMSRAHFRLRYSNWKEGLEEMRHAQALAEQVQDTVVWLLCLYMGGYAAFRQGDKLRGRADLEQAFASMRTLGIKLHFGVAGAFLAEVLWEDAETSRALAVVQEAYTVASDNNDYHSQSVAARVLGTLLARNDQRTEGERYLRESLEIARQHEIQPFIAEAALALAYFYRQAGSAEQAARYYDQARTFYLRTNMSRWLDLFDEPTANYAFEAED